MQCLGGDGWWGTCLQGLAIPAWAGRSSPALQLTAPLFRDGGSERVSWEAVAAELGTGRTAQDCKGKWQRMLLRLAEDEYADGEGHQSGEGSAEESRQQQPRQQKSWSETEADTAAQLLGAVGARLAADSRFALSARNFPAKLKASVSLNGGLAWNVQGVEGTWGCATPFDNAAYLWQHNLLPQHGFASHPTCLQCQELWVMPLAQRLPGRTTAQVKDKCRNMAEFAIKVRRELRIEKLDACLKKGQCS